MYEFAGGTLRSIAYRSIAYRSICLFQVSNSRPHQKRVKALVDCRAVSSEQLAFFKDEIIVVTATNDPHWWVSVTTDSLQPISHSVAAFCMKAQPSV